MPSPKLYEINKKITRLRAVLNDLAVKSLIEGSNEYDDEIRCISQKLDKLVLCYHKLT